MTSPFQTQLEARFRRLAARRDHRQGRRPAIRRALTARECQLVLANPQIGWPADLEAEAQSWRHKMLNQIRMTCFASHDSTHGRGSGHIQGRSGAVVEIDPSPLS